jgi:hypothetical protein
MVIHNNIRALVFLGIMVSCAGLLCTPPKKDQASSVEKPGTPVDFSAEDQELQGIGLGAPVPSSHDLDLEELILRLNLIALASPSAMATGTPDHAESSAGERNEKKRSFAQMEDDGISDDERSADASSPAAEDRGSRDGDSRADDAEKAPAAKKSNTPADQIKQ